MIQGVSSNSNSQSYYTVQQNYNTMLESAGIPSEVISQGQSAIEEYAKQNNITLPTVQQPKSNQRAQTQEGNLFGKQNDAESEAPDMTDELISLGFPAPQAKTTRSYSFNRLSPATSRPTSTLHRN